MNLSEMTDHHHWYKAWQSRLFAKVTRPKWVQDTARWWIAGVCCYMCVCIILVSKTYFRVTELALLINRILSYLFTYEEYCTHVHSLNPSWSHVSREKKVIWYQYSNQVNTDAYQPRRYRVCVCMCNLYMCLSRAEMEPVPRALLILFGSRIDICALLASVLDFYTRKKGSSHLSP